MPCFYLPYLKVESVASFEKSTTDLWCIKHAERGSADMRADNFCIHKASYVKF